MASDDSAVLRAAVERFFKVQGRWPSSMEDLDPFGIRGFGTFTVAGFAERSGDELCLRYIRPRGKVTVRIQRPRTVECPSDIRQSGP